MRQGCGSSVPRAPVILCRNSVTGRTSVASHGEIFLVHLNALPRMRTPGPLLSNVRVSGPDRYVWGPPTARAFRAVVLSHDFRLCRGPPLSQYQTTLQSVWIEERALLQRTGGARLHALRYSAVRSGDAARQTRSDPIGLLAWSQGLHGGPSRECGGERGAGYRPNLFQDRQSGYHRRAVYASRMRLAPARARPLRSLGLRIWGNALRYADRR